MIPQIHKKWICGMLGLMSLCHPLPSWGAAPQDPTGLPYRIEGASSEDVNWIRTKHADSDFQVTHPDGRNLIMTEFIVLKGYESAQWFKKGSEQILKLKKTPIISKIEWKGIQHFSQSEVEREFGINAGQALDLEKLSTNAESLRRFYSDQGFLQAKISLSYPQHSQGQLPLEVQIYEGPQSLIEAVLIESSNEKLNSMQKSWFKSRRREPFTELALSEMRQELRKILSKEKYYRAEIGEPKVKFSEDQSRVTIIFNVNNPTRYYIRTDGTKYFSEGKALDELNIESYFTSNPSISSELAVKLKNFYLSQGFARAEVIGEETELTQQHERQITLMVKEGPRIRIKDIQFSGRFSLSNAEMVRLFQRLSGEMTVRDYFVKAELDQAIEKLFIERQNEGFLKIRLINTRSIFNKAKDSVNVTIVIDEGPQTIVDRIEFDGLKSYPEHEALTIINLRPGEPLRLNRLESGLRDLKRFFRDRSYLEMEVLNEKKDLLIYNDDNTKARIQIKIHEGPKIRVGSIQVEGNVITQEKVILKELEFEPGDDLTPSRIDESLARLQRLGHFTSIDIRTLEEKSNLSNRTILVRVKDRDPGLFNMGAGATNERGLTLRGYAGAAYRNLGGTGRGTSIRLDGNYNVSEIRYLESKATIGYLEPYLFDSRTRGRFNFTQSISLTNYDKLLASELRQFILTAEQDLTSHILFSWDLINFARYRDFSIRGDPEYPTNLTDIGSLGPTLDLDFRDHPFNPTKGTFTRFSLEYGSPWLGSNDAIEFIRGNAGTTLYSELTNKLVWANSVRLGHLRNLKRLGSVPYDKKGFSLGGQSTIRGYDPSEVFPNEKELGTLRYELSTEANLALVKSEFRFPVWGNIGGAIFYDGGMVNIRDLSFEDYYRDSIGVAIRYLTPVGPLNLEYAWKLDRNSNRNENPSLFHLSIGAF